MCSKLKIGITQRVDRIGSYHEWRDALDQRLIDWVIQANFFPVPIPNTIIDINLSNHEQLVLHDWLRMVKLDALLLSGGNNIGDIQQRDLTEQYLLSWAEKNRKPVLGVCRGMQMMGVYMGIGLVEIDGHVKSHHKLRVNSSDSSLLPATVNSYHNLVLESCPDRFEVLAKSEDGSLEAIKHKKLPWEGWMWHPEREEKFSEINQERFKKLMNGWK